MSNFLRNDIDLMALLPAYFKIVKDFQELMNTEEIELSLFWDYMVRVWNNLFIQTADSDTLKYHEDLLKIQVDPNDTLEIRRWRILNYYRRKSPFTLISLYELLNESVGIGNWTVDIDYPNYTATIDLELEDEAYLNEIIRTLILSLPAHIGQIYNRTTRPDTTTTKYSGIGLSFGQIYEVMGA